MDVGYITPEQLPVFRSLLLPDTAYAIERGDPVTALGLTEGDIAVGALAGYLEHNRFQISSLYVAPDYRRRGGGRMLIETLIPFLLKLPGQFDLEIHYLATAPDHKTLAPFLAALGFALEEDKTQNLYLTTVAQAACSPFFGENGSRSDQILPFAQIPDICLSMADKDLRLDDVPLPEEPLDSPELERDISCALVRGGEVQAFAAFDHSYMDMLTLSCVWTGEAGPGAIPLLLRQAFLLGSDRYPPETPLVIQAVVPAAAELIRTLLPDAAPISFVYSRSLHTDFE